MFTEYSRKREQDKQKDTKAERAKEMAINDTNRENIRSALKALERKVLNRAGGCFSGEDAENFIEAVVFLKERGYPLAAGRDSGSDALKTYESLPEEDREVLDGLGYPSNLGKLLDEGVAEAVIKLFCKSPLFQRGYGLETLSAGELFAEVVSCYDTRRMHAGTIRQGDNIAAIMQDLLLKGVKAGPDGRISVYDMAMGTGLMLSAVAEKAGVMCPKAHVVCCGQEKDPHKYTLAKAAAMLKGLDHDYANADVIPEDRFVGQTFSLGVTGFPIETNWGKNAKEVIEEYKAIPFGRFQPGLPSVSDVQVLYLLNGISKMADGGKMAIVMTDDALLDPRAKEMENIRKYVLGNDLIETIVRTKAKPKIRKFSCIYLLNKKKLAKRREKIQIINIESEMVEGKDIVLQAYKEFRNRVYEDGDYMIESRILSTADYEGMLIRKE